MASKNISDFRTEMDVYCKGISSQTTFVDGQILRVIRDFCRHTWYWRYTLAKITVVDTQANYTLTMIDTDGKNELLAVDWVKWKEDGEADTSFKYVNPVNLVTMETPDITGWPADQVAQEADAPQSYWVENDRVLWLNPIPNENAAGTQNLQVKVVVIPTLAAVKVPVNLYNEWLETISLGVAGRVMNMAAHKWYNPKLADRYMYQYKIARDELKKQRWFGKNRNNGKLIMPYQGGSAQSKWSF